MPYLLNLIYLVAASLLAPWLCWQAWFRKKPLRGLAAKWLGRNEIPIPAGKPVVWFHGVSLGEIHLLRQLVAQFRLRFPDWQCVVSTTTNTGYDEARKCFADLPVIYWPFDFTWAVRSALQTVQPSLVVLSEGEIWPNFIHIASQLDVRIAVVNGRMSPRSAHRFRQFGWLLAGVFAKLDRIAAQNEEYRRHYLSLGARDVITTGNIKYDGVNLDRRNSRTLAMRDSLGILPDELVWVAGSTQAPEESLAIEIYRKAKSVFPKLRLIVVPRHPERFDEVARLLQRSGLPLVRRSEILQGHGPSVSDGILLGDTMGELGAIWGCAHIAYVGGSLDGKRGGQNMIEPSAYGSAVLFGPHTWNFKQTVADLLAAGGALQVQDAADLETAIMRLLNDADLRERLGLAARQFVMSQQGATGRTLDVLQSLMNPASSGRLAA